MVPTHKPMIRKDFPDVIYKTEKAKFEAVVEEIQSCYERGQPTLVGTISIEKSELLGKMLKKKGIPHEVLNAKHHEREAEIVALAGQRKAVTIATNMAGRGTDIVLGEGVERTRRPAHYRHRAPREQADRQPAPGPVRQTGGIQAPRAFTFPWKMT